MIPQKRKPISHRLSVKVTDWDSVRCGPYDYHHPHHPCNDLLEGRRDLVAPTDGKRRE